MGHVTTYVTLSDHPRGGGLGNVVFWVRCDAIHAEEHSEMMAGNVTAEAERAAAVHIMADTGFKSFKLLLYHVNVIP